MLMPKSATTLEPSKLTGKHDCQVGMDKLFHALHATFVFDSSTIQC